MFDKNLIPPQDPQLKQLLSSIYGKTGATADQHTIIDKKLEKIDQTIKEKIVSTLTISEYFDQAWKQADLKDTDKESVVKKLEAIQENTKIQIKNGEQDVAKTSANLDVITASFKMTPFEEFNLIEKMKEVRKKRNLEVETAVFANHKADLEVLHALNRPYYSAQNISCPDALHYTAGLCDTDEDESSKQQKAVDFVKKIQDKKKALRRKYKQLERNGEDRELEELERLRQKRQEEEEQRQKDKKSRLEAQIQLLKARSETRIKETTKWEEDYKSHLNKRPLYKEIEDKFNKGFKIPELEERKRKLQEIRDFHKPIAREELAEHEQRVKRIFEETNLKKKEESEAFKWQYKKPSFASKHHKEFADEISIIKNQKDVDQLVKLKRREKVMELMQEVKEKHVPRADPQKELELMTLIEKLKKNNPKNNRSRTIADEEEVDDHVNSRKLGNEYLKSVKELVQRRKKDLSRPETEVNNTRDGDSKKQTVTSMKSEPTFKKINYLAELRRENKMQSSGSQVENIIKNKKLESSEKKGLLRSEIEKLEEKAKRKEMVKKFKINKKNLEDVDEDDEVDQIYISAIKAKLEMLGN